MMSSIDSKIFQALSPFSRYLLKSENPSIKTWNTFNKLRIIKFDENKELYYK